MEGVTLGGWQTERFNLLGLSERVLHFSAFQSSQEHCLSAISWRVLQYIFSLSWFCEKNFFLKNVLGKLKRGVSSVGVGRNWDARCDSWWRRVLNDWNLGKVCFLILVGFKWKHGCGK